MNNRNVKACFLNLYLIANSIFLSGCHDKDLNSINWQLSPDKPQTKTIQNKQVTFTLPSSVLNKKNVTDFFEFDEYHTGPESKQEKLTLRKTDTAWEIERRTDNGISGSGKVFFVSVSSTEKNKITTFALVPNKEKSYQEGLVFPFAIPDFNIIKHLSTPSFRFTIEENTTIDFNTIKGNFSRSLKEKEPNYIRFDTPQAIYNGKINFYHYKGGTKIVSEVFAKIKYNNELNKDIGYMIKEYKNRMQMIINM